MSIFQTLARALATWKGPKPTPMCVSGPITISISISEARIVVSEHYVGADRRQRQDPNQNHLRRRDDWPELPPVNRD